jgi:tripartite-type tricarboxylate transporter receptor subunit TctC
MIRTVVTLLAALCAVATGAHAETFPSRPITLIVPFSPGGSTDAVARIVVEGMRPALGQPIIIEHVAGAGGTIGVGRLVRSAPDGYTIGIGQWSSHVGASAIYPVSYNVLTDLEPISMVSIGALWIVARKNIPGSDMKGVIAWLKANPGKATAGTLGVGSGSHLCLVAFQNYTGTQFALVPYRGAAPAMQDLLAGQIDLFCPEAGSTAALYHAGSIKALAILREKRWFGAPEVPTTDEAGAGVHFPFWNGLWAPKGTPKDVVAKLNAAVRAALADPLVRERYAKLGHDIAPPEQQTPEALGAYLKAEIEKWSPIMKAANIKPNIKPK